MEWIQTSLEGGLFRITINRVDKKNALTKDMYSAMGDALDLAAGDKNARVVIFQGMAGIYTSGNDIKDFLENPPKSLDAPVFVFIKKLQKFEKPIIAAVDGLAIGIGTTMLLHCDLVYATANVRFQLPFANLGLCPEAGSSYLLPAACGYVKAAEFLLLGNPFNSHQALAAGIINDIVPPEELNDTVTEVAGQLAAKPPATLRLIKSLMKAKDKVDLVAWIDVEGKHFGECLDSPEAREAFTAFMEKRAPDFSEFE